MTTSNAFDTTDAFDFDAEARRMRDGIGRGHDWSASDDTELTQREI